MAHPAIADVLGGIDVLARDNFRLLQGRNVAILVNHTSRDRDGNHLLDLLLGANVNVVAIFTPEHGLQGALDEKVPHGTEPKTGLPVYSLYSEVRRPTDRMLRGIDTFVVDLHYVGTRFYTRSVTMGYCMQESARRGIRFVVLDRPNPTTGLIVDGPIADEDHFGFTAFGPLPVAHGMTFGELAQMYNREWNINCDLVVVRMENWKRSMWFDETGLMWVSPSPNMRNLTQATLYPAVCLIEATNISVGRGTDQPFETLGAPWIDGRELAAELNAAELPGIRFVPLEFTPASSKFANQKCQGVYILVTDRNAVEPVRTGVTIAWTLRKLYPDAFDFEKVKNLLHSAKTMDAIRNARDPREIEKVWRDELEQFKRVRARHLIYE